jgi:hypothetical protein
MQQSDVRLDARTVDLVRRAWDSLEVRYRKSQGGNHWSDNEADTGPLKDADGLLCVIEPFLLSPESFVEPPLTYEQICDRCQVILDEILSGASPSSGYRGFTAAPYPYTNEVVDYVDAAATYLRLICAVADLAAALAENISEELTRLLREVAIAATHFLLEAQIDDRNGIRWAGTAVRSDSPSRLANLFFTNVAALSLKRATDNVTIATWVGPEIVATARASLRHVPKWVGSQYAASMQNFWMDESKGIVQPIGVVYAVETVYGLLSEVPEALRANCAAALHAVAQRIPSVDGASALQNDFFHVVPLPTGTSIFYDDRRYIAAFLNAFALLKSRDADAMTDPLIRAAELLVTGVTSEWIDTPTGLWDDGRPLICYTLDALTSTVRYFLEGIVPTISLRENTLRDAVRQALSSPEVVDAVVTLLKGKALGQIQEDIVGQMAVAALK